MSVKKRKPRAKRVPGTPKDIPAGIKPLHISCPTCGLPHYDVGAWRTKPHETHLCLHCGCKFKVDAEGIKTVGIRPEEQCVYGIVVTSFQVDLNNKNVVELERMRDTGLWGPRIEDVIRNIVWKFLREHADYLDKLEAGVKKLRAKRKGRR